MALFLLIFVSEFYSCLSIKLCKAIRYSGFDDCLPDFYVLMVLLCLNSLSVPCVYLAFLTLSAPRNSIQHCS